MGCNVALVVSMDRKSASDIQVQCSYDSFEMVISWNYSDDEHNGCVQKQSHLSTTGGDFINLGPMTLISSCLNLA
jgi:hypothetical protein